MKKLIILLFTCMLLTLVACDSDLEIIGIEIANYPDKLIYIIGIDDSVVLDGGEVYLITKAIAKGYSTRGSAKYDMSDDRQVNITHNIDFGKEGIYKVTSERNKHRVSYPVQVISIETLEEMIYP